MPNLIVVNGETWWADEFPAWQVTRVKVQQTAWLLNEGRLWVRWESRLHPVDAVLWRVGAVRVTEAQRTALHMIRLAGVPCFNSPLAIENGHHRLGMLATLREVGATTIPFNVASGDHVAQRLSPEFPAVVKVGTHHGGLGKYRVEQASEWGELTDLLYAADDFISIEPWTAHRRDVRCLVVGENVWAMERVGSSWRANVDTKAFNMISPPPLLEQWTRDLAVRLGAPIMSIDALETMDGQWVVLESNETPGISGFPPSVRDCIVRLVDAANPDLR